jgi:peptidoglycan/LPS O-acetylase OafA/YrhL
MILVQGMMAALERLLRRIPRWIRLRLISVCGIACLTAPLLLMMSMSIWYFQLILTVWFACMLVLSLMIWSSPDERI